MFLNSLLPKHLDRFLFCITSLTLFFAGPIVAQQQNTHDIIKKDISFISNRRWTFDAKIAMPTEQKRNGFGVLMVGGRKEDEIGNDLNWTTRGSITFFSKKTPRGPHTRQKTVSGKPHTDAPTIAENLAQQGFVVMHFSTLSRNDPKKKTWPDDATFYTPRVLLRITRDALKTFRAQQLFPAKQVILLGHSLGATRAANLAFEDNQVAGLVLLSCIRPCRLSAEDDGSSRWIGRFSARRSQTLIGFDKDRDRKIDPKEFAQWLKSKLSQTPPPTVKDFKFFDRNRDRLIDSHELWLAFARIARRKISADNSSEKDKDGLYWVENLIQKKKTPTLFVYGALDAEARYDSILRELAIANKLAHVQIKTFPKLGHNLGKDQTGIRGYQTRVAPIDPTVPGYIGEFLRKGIVERLE